jgi:hypothetical protein
VSDLHEDHESLRLKARRERDRMAECFHQSKEAFTSNQKRLAKELSIMGRAHKENMVRLNEEASAKIFEGAKSTNGTSFTKLTSTSHRE